MAALSTYWPTLLDVARRLDPNGSISAVAEILNQTNEILDDIPFVEGNLPTGHKTTLRAKIPTPTWRLLNQGVVPVKSTTNQITEVCGILEARSEVDCDMAKMNGNTAEWRLSEDLPIIEGIGQELASTLIDGDTSIDPEQFVGLSPRYYSLASSVTTSENIIDGGGTGSDNTSVWLVGWSNATVHGIYPKGSKAGLTQEDLGKQTVITDMKTGARMEAYVTRYQQVAGLCVRDWRYAVRIANIDISDLETAGDAADSSANLIKLMSIALDKIPNLSSCRPVFYMNNRVRAMLRVKLMSKSNVFLTLEDLKGASGITRPTLQFMGVPCRRVDAIGVAEEQIS
jgi:hypothetical protein